MEKIRGDVAAITQQADAMQRERDLGSAHIIKLRRKINERKIEDFHTTVSNRGSVLAHKSAETNSHVGSTFESYLKEEGTYEETTATAIARVNAYKANRCALEPGWDVVN